MSPSKKNYLTNLHDLESFVKPGLSITQVSEIKAAFDLFDLHETGYVQTNDIRNCLLQLGLEETNPTLMEMVADLDSCSRSGTPLTFPKFLDMISGRYKKRSEKQSYEEILRLFQLFDTSGVGFISYTSLKKACDDIGETFTTEELNEMIRRADKDKDGMVTIDDFYRIMTQRPL